MPKKYLGNLVPAKAIQLTKTITPFQEDCCQLPGTYTLTCIDSGGKRDPRRWGAPAFKQGVQNIAMIGKRK